MNTPHFCQSIRQLDSIIRASSLVEMVNACIRPYLHSCKGQITQETFNLVMFYHNHRRYKSGKRQGKAPIALLTGPPLEAEWVELLRQQGGRRQDATLSASRTSRPPLELRPNPHWCTTQSAAPPGQAIFEHTAASENPCQQTDAEAA